MFNVKKRDDASTVSTEYFDFYDYFATIKK